MPRFAASVSQKRCCKLQDIEKLSGFGVYCLFWRILQLYVYCVALSSSQVTSSSYYVGHRYLEKGALASTTATAVKMSHLKRICFFSYFVAFLPSRLRCQMKLNFPGVEFLGSALKFRERESYKVRRRVFTSFIKRRMKFA